MVNAWVVYRKLSAKKMRINKTIQRVNGLSKLWDKTSNGLQKTIHGKTNKISSEKLGARGEKLRRCRKYYENMSIEEGNKRQDYMWKGVYLLRCLTDSHVLVTLMSQTFPKWMISIGIISKYFYSFIDRPYLFHSFLDKMSNFCLAFGIHKNFWR